ncbi:hypothetical protein PR048_027943 [Dryococelus australis]|uniref:Uncharacterized protein n=1 Tax=Dryococelus australis TaxID=614101 RepID=A0ABQ9GHY4_9NEOP|nr:hypothetical protein PR048_027943 [Dryococelus australis]
MPGGTKTNTTIQFQLRASQLTDIGYSGYPTGDLACLQKSLCQRSLKCDTQLMFSVRVVERHWVGGEGRPVRVFVCELDKTGGAAGGEVRRGNEGEIYFQFENGEGKDRRGSTGIRGGFQNGGLPRFVAYNERPEKFASSMNCRLDSTVVCTIMSISTAHWLSAVTVEGDYWFSALQEVSNSVWTTAKGGRLGFPLADSHPITNGAQCSKRIIRCCLDQLGSSEWTTRSTQEQPLVPGARITRTSEMTSLANKVLEERSLISALITYWPIDSRANREHFAERDSQPRDTTVHARIPVNPLSPELISELKRCNRLVFMMLTVPVMGTCCVILDPAQYVNVNNFAMDATVRRTTSRSVKKNRTRSWNRLYQALIGEHLSSALGSDAVLLARAAGVLGKGCFFASLTSQHMCNGCLAAFSGVAAIHSVSLSSTLVDGSCCVRRVCTALNKHHRLVRHRPRCGRLWVRIPELSSAGRQERGKWEIHEKTRLPVTSFGTISNCENLGGEQANRSATAAL